jgi:hypothetical protein
MTDNSIHSEYPIESGKVFPVPEDDDDEMDGLVAAYDEAADADFLALEHAIETDWHQMKLWALIVYLSEHNPNIDVFLAVDEDGNGVPFSPTHEDKIVIYFPGWNKGNSSK